MKKEDQSSDNLSNAKTYLHSVVCICQGCYANNTGEFLYVELKGNYGRFLARLERMKKQDRLTSARAAAVSDYTKG